MKPLIVGNVGSATSGGLGETTDDGFFTSTWGLRLGETNDGISCNFWISWCLRTTLKHILLFQPKKNQSLGSSWMQKHSKLYVFSCIRQEIRLTMVIFRSVVRQDGGRSFRWMATRSPGVFFLFWKVAQVAGLYTKNWMPLTGFWNIQNSQRNPNGPKDLYYWNKS